MLLVAVTGPIASGKSTTLSHLLNETSGLSVDGFIAVTGERDLEGRGAISYDLLMAGSGETLPYLTRSESGYDVNGQTSRDLELWAARVQPGLDLLFIDEFGKWETEGQGHWSTYQTLAAKKPKMVVFGVRESARVAVEERLGKPFDVVVSATDPARLSILLNIANERPDWERVGLFGAGCGVLEVSLGSALHAVYFPGTGLTMASTQAATLTLAASRLSIKTRSGWIGIITSGLKAFSPAGSKIGPMLAISMQGLLYNWAIVALGWNAVGVAVGGSMMGIWAASQGFLIQYLMLGKSLDKAYDEICRWIGRTLSVPTPSLAGLMLGVVGLYGLVSGLVAWQVFRTKTTLESDVKGRFSDQRARLASLKKVSRHRFVKPLALLLPTAIVLVILVNMGTRSTEIFLLAIRSLAVALILNAIVKRWNPMGLAEGLRKRGLWGPSYALRTAIAAKKLSESDES